MSTLLFALISLGISAAVVLSSFAWWASYRGGTPTSTVDREAHGFPVAYYTVESTYRWIPRNASSVPITTIVDLEWQTLIVDILVIFILSLAILTLFRWRALRSSGRRDRRRVPNYDISRAMV